MTSETTRLAAPNPGPMIPLSGGIELHVFLGDRTSYLLRRGDASLLIDCHSRFMRQQIESRGLPLPGTIVHTHVQPEHCREADQFPDARILVHEPSRVLASDREQWARQACTTWTHPEDWPDTMGEEPYGVAGRITRFPPDPPLILGATFRVGDTIACFVDDEQGPSLEVLSLPIHDKEAVGLALRMPGAGGSEAPVVFIGDLMRSPACLVDLYHLEKSYGGLTLNALPEAIDRVKATGASLWAPATGAPMVDGPQQGEALLAKLEAYQQAARWRSADFTPARAVEAVETVGRYRRIADGVYQITNFGNCIVLIDEQGAGLMVDPGTVGFELPQAEREALFQEDMALLAAKAGLQSIERVLLTHYHGDHVEMTPEVRKRYPNVRVAAWDLVARVVAAPWDYPYAANLPWYGLGASSVPVDDVLTRSQPYLWRGRPIRSVALPGHCYAHAAYLMPFRGLRLAFTGDTLQSQGDAVGVGFIMSNHSVPDGDEGVLGAMRALAGERVDLNLGGHGTGFRDAQPVYRESVRRIEHGLPALRALAPGGDLACAMRWPDMPRLIPVD